MFAKWLSIITEKEINNKSIIENACIEEAEIQMAMTALQRQSEDKIIRQAYQRRKDDFVFVVALLRQKRLKAADFWLATQQRKLKMLYRRFDLKWAETR